MSTTASKHTKKNRSTGKSGHILSRSTIDDGLSSLRIPKDSVVRYEAAITTAGYPLIAHGAPEEAARAHDIIQGTNMEASEHHQFSNK
jgi:hypothetical protein